MRAMATALLSAACLFAQSGEVNGTIKGVITDPTGTPVSYAAVQAVNLDTGFQRSVTSDASGAYEVPLLPLGQYKLTVTKDGFAKYEQSGIGVRLDNVSQVDVALRLGASQ